MPSAAHVRERALVRRLLAGPAPPAIEVEELALAIVGRLANDARKVQGEAAGRPARPATAARHREIAEDARSHVGRHFREPLSLRGVAREVGTSTYHLSRLFRRSTGYTVHGYLTQLRLRAVLDVLADDRVPPARLAVDLGFASHSHFTAAFRSAFGFPPRETCKISKA